MLGDINNDLDCDSILNEDDLDDDGDGIPEFDNGPTLLDCDDSDSKSWYLNDDYDCDGILNVDDLDDDRRWNS